MADAAIEASAIEDLAATDLREACRRARSLVAEHPYDEQAAELLTRLVADFASDPPQPPNRELGYPPELQQAFHHLNAGEEEKAEIILRAYLQNNREDVRAMAMMAEIAARCDMFDNALKILIRAEQIDPRSVDVLLALGKVANHLSYLEHSEDRGDEALKFLDRALAIEPDNIRVVSLYSAILVRFRRLTDCIHWYDRLLELDPVNWLAWTNYGMMLTTLGRFGDSIAALRTATAVNPLGGLAWWEIANLKISNLFDRDVERMEQALADPAIETAAKSQIHFALARAYDQRAELDKAAAQWKAANAIKRKLEPHDADEITQDVDESIRTFTPAFFAARLGFGDPRPDPIFIIGMQRSGTTLLEQILASHSAIEGTEELFVLLQIATELSQRHPGQTWHGALASRPEQDVRAMAAGLLNLAQHHRVTDAPFFIDKNPSNWRLAGLIMTILPNAKIIDVRRNPMDCCFANWAQYYENGLGFSYSQEALGRFYADYVRLMRHFDQAAPGRIHRVVYEDLVADFEPNVRAVFDYLELPFEEACLRFYETERAVLTPSAHQVRRPINRSGMGRSQRYEPWLGELRNALGDSATNWRS